MNPITPADDIDTRARAAGAAVRVRGADLADTDRAWSDLVQALDTDDSVVVDLDRERFDRAPGSGRRWLGVAAALVVVMGLAATFVAVRSGSDDDPVAAAPMGQWMLPAAGSGFSASSGSVSESPGGDPGLVRSIAVVGRPDGDRFVDLIEVTVADAPSEGSLPAGDGWEQLDTAAGEVWRLALAEDFVDLGQVRGDRWIMTMSSPADEAVAIELLATLSIDDTGTVALDPTAGFELLETVSVDDVEWTPLAITSYQVDGPGINEEGIGPVLVETAETAESLAGSAVLGSVRSVTIQGHSGWEVSRPDVDGEWWGYVWNVDGVTIAVSGHEDAAIVRAVAESLVAVDEATWRTATGAGPTETIAP